jgi:TIR domain
MPFNYSCFISYKHGQNQLTEKIINDLQVALEAELSQYFNEGIFIDRDRLKGGTFFNENLATALCQSVCMIVVYNVVYFKSNYCLREFRAMEKLEAKRLGANPKNGLIIPIVFRGINKLPNEIKGRRQFYDFETFDPTVPGMINEKRYYDKIKEIASYIYDRYEELQATNTDYCVECGSFKLPDEKEVVPIAVEGAAFPSRTEATK